VAVNHRNFFLMVLEAGSVRSECWPSWVRALLGGRFLLILTWQKEPRRLLQDLF